MHEVSFYKIVTEQLLLIIIITTYLNLRKQGRWWGSTLHIFLTHLPVDFATDDVFLVNMHEYRYNLQFTKFK
jgi:hypothetical protein